MYIFIMKVLLYNIFLELSAFFLHIYIYTLLNILNSTNQLIKMQVLETKTYYFR